MGPLKSPGKLLLVALISGIVGIALLELAGSLVLSILTCSAAAPIRERAHCVHDPLLGWVSIPDHRVPDLYGPGISLTTNERGFRGSRGVTSEVPAGRYRITCLGDSFTLGYGVADDETYAARIEVRSPSIEAVNMGMGGYGIDQCYLWYLRESSTLKTNLLLFAVIRDDFYRMTTTRFANLYDKPILHLDERGELVAANTPVPNRWSAGGVRGGLRCWLRETALFRLVRSDSPLRADLSRADVLTTPVGAEPFAAVATKVFENLAASCREARNAFVVVYLPDRIDLAHQSRSFPEWLATTLSERSIPFIDLTPLFLAQSPSQWNTLFLGDGHYTVLGNDHVAKALLEELPSNVAGFPKPPVSR